MRLALVSCLVFSGCLSIGFVRARPSLEVDGRHRAIHVTLAPEVPNSFSLRSDQPMAVGTVSVSQWRMSVGQALVEGLSETLVVVDEAAPDVLELEIREASPTMLAVQGPTMMGGQGPVMTQSTLFTQIDYRALLKTPEGEVLARAAGVAKGSLPGTSMTNADRMVASAIEELVRQVGNKTVPAIPEQFAPSSRFPRTVWYDTLKAAAGKPSAAPPPQHACQAEAFPEWRTATAAEKKVLLERCR